MLGVSLSDKLVIEYPLLKPDLMLLQILVVFINEQSCALAKNNSLTDL